MPVQIVKTPPAIRPVVLAEESDRFADQALKKLKLYGQDMDARFERAVQDGRITETIEAASTLTFTVLDPELELLTTSKFTNQKFDVKLDDTWFRLVGISKSGDSLELTFEDRIVAWLRAYTKPRKAFRDQVTRAEFILSLLQEVKEGTIRFYCPELHKIQPIRQTAATRGLAAGAGGTIQAGSVKWDYVTYAGTYGDLTSPIRFNDPGDDSFGSQPPASGMSPNVPMIALDMRAAPRDPSERMWCVVLSPEGEAGAIPIGDVGPSPGLGPGGNRKLDVNSAAVLRYFKKQKLGNGFGTDEKLWRVKLCGRGDAGMRAAQALINAPNGRTATSSTARSAQRTDDAARNPGLAEAEPTASAAGLTGAESASLTVKGVKARQDQIRVGSACLAIANELKAPYKARVALVETLIAENTMTNNRGGDGSSNGAFQVTAPTARGMGIDPLDLEACCKAFLTRGFYGQGGAIKLAGTGKTAAQVAQAVQGSAFSDGSNYARWQSEAIKWVQAFGGSTDAGAGDATTLAQTVKSVKRYAFQRGGQGEPENTWQCALRLASQVGWRRFVYANTFMLIAEEDLFASRPRMEISRDHEAVDDIDFSIVMGHRPPKVKDPKKNESVAEMSVACRTDRWQAPPGTIVEVVDTGPANGLWLVTSKDRGYFDRDGNVTLKKPIKELPEPAPEVVEKNITAPGGSDEGGAEGGSGKVVRPWVGRFPVTDPFGAPRDYGGHLGIDIGAPTGTTCIAAFDGEITAVTTSGFGTAGGMIHLKNTQGKQLKGGIRPGEKIGWGHIRSAKVRVGDKVKAGQAIAVSNGSPPHIHFVKLRAGAGGLQGTDDPTPFLRTNGFI